jgi:hypothetical protein
MALGSIIQLPLTLPDVYAGSVSLFLSYFSLLLSLSNCLLPGKYLYSESVSQKLGIGGTMAEFFQGQEK